MPAKRYRVRLSAEEQEEQRGLVSKGRAAAYRQTHARILLLGVPLSCQHSSPHVQSYPEDSLYRRYRFRPTGSIPCVNYVWSQTGHATCGHAPPEVADT